MQSFNDERGKLFVGGLSWETTHGSLLKFFSRYGEVVDCVVMKNPGTGKSRGFGFITFRDPACVEMVLSSAPHTLDGRQIDPKACNPRSMNKGGKNLENSRRKIFIGGLPVSITDAQLRDEFSKYGKVTDVVIMFDQQKQKSRGFGFLTFESEESVEAVIQEHFVEVNGKQVEVKKAEPRDLKMIADSSLSAWGSSLSASFSFLQHGGTALAVPGAGGLLSPMTLGGGALSGLPGSWYPSPSAGLRLVQQGSPYVLINPTNGGLAVTPSPTNGMTAFHTWSSPAALPVQAPAVFESPIQASPYSSMLGADVTTMYILNPITSQAGFAQSTAQFAPPAVDSGQAAADKSLAYHLALGGYGLGGLGASSLCRSILAAGGSGSIMGGTASDSVSPLAGVTMTHCGGGAFIAPSAAYGRMASNHVMAAPSFHPYRR